MREYLPEQIYVSRSAIICPLAWLHKVSVTFGSWSCLSLTALSAGQGEAVLPALRIRLTCQLQTYLVS